MILGVYNMLDTPRIIAIPVGQMNICGMNRHSAADDLFDELVSNFPSRDYHIRLI